MSDTNQATARAMTDQERASMERATRKLDAEVSAELASRSQKTTDPRLEAATQAVYDCEMPDGDALAVLIHLSDYIDDRVPVEPDQINQIKSICRTIAKAALDAADRVQSGSCK